MQQLISIDENSHNIGEEFKEFLNRQTEIINNLISNNLSNYIYASNIIQIKIDIYNFLQNKIIMILTDLNKNNNHKNAKENSEKISLFFQILSKINNFIKEKELSLYKIIGILHSKVKGNFNESSGQTLENENLIKENCHLKSELIEKNKQIKVLENMNNILNEKIEKAKLENDTLTSKLFGRTIKYNNDSTIKTEYEIELKNKNDKNN